MIQPSLDKTGGKISPRTTQREPKMALAERLKREALELKHKVEDLRKSARKSVRKSGSLRPSLQANEKTRGRDSMRAISKMSEREREEREELARMTKNPKRIPGVMYAVDRSPVRTWTQLNTPFRAQTDAVWLKGKPTPGGLFTEYGLDSQTAARILRIGVAAGCLAEVSDGVGLGKAELAQIVGIDRTTATRLASNKKALPLHAAEGLLRVIELEAIARDTFGSQNAALGWLNKKHPMLDEETPFQASKTSYGTKQVKDLLVAIKYGGVV